LSLPPGTYRSEIEYRGTNPVQIEDLTTRELGDIAEAAQEFYFGKSTQRLTVADWQGAGSGRIRTYRVGPEGEEFVASQFFNADGELELSLPPGIYRSEVEYRNTNPVQIQTIAVRQVEDADEAPRAFYFGKGEARLALRDHEGAGVGRGLAYLVDPETGTEQLVSSGSVNGAGTLDLSLPLGTYRLEVEYRGTLPYQRAETAEIVIADRTGIEKNFYFEKGTVLVEAEVAGEAAEGRVLVFRHESAGERQVFNRPLEQGRIEFELPAGIYRFVASHTAVSPIEEQVSRAVQVRDATQTRRIFFFGRDEVVGDFDGSGLVDFQDLFLFAQAWGGTDTAFDLDGNGSVDLEDFSVFTGLFGSGAFIGE
jgi:hypothetical protein